MKKSNIEIVEQDGYRLIATAGGKLGQGVIKIDEPNLILSPFVQKCVDKINSLSPGSEVLLIGGGTFTIPKHTKESIHLDIIELDTEMYSAAVTYFGYNEKANHMVYFGDGVELAENFKDQEKRYDLIIVDVFGENEVPKEFRDYSFYETLSWMTDNVIINEISSSTEVPYFDYPDLDDVVEI